MTESVPDTVSTVQPSLEELRCEACGYELRGLTVEVKCPECGKPVRESMQRARIGTPWQRRRGISGWLVTFRGSLLHQEQILRVATDRPGRNTAFYLWNSLISGAMPFCAFSLMMGILAPFGKGETTITGIVIFAILGSLFASLLIAFFALLAFYFVWSVAAITIRRFPTDTGILAASVASSWLSIGSAICGLTFVVTPVIGPLATILLPAGFVIGWIGYAVACYKALSSVRYANFPLPCSPNPEVPAS